MIERDHRSLMTVAVLSILLGANSAAAEPPSETKAASETTAPATNKDKAATPAEKPEEKPSAQATEKKPEPAKDEKSEAKADATPPATPPSESAKAPEKADTAAPSATPSVPETKANPIVTATRDWLKGYSATAKINKDDMAAASEFYGSRDGAPLWVTDAGFTSRAKSAMDEIKKADDWGLEASAFTLPDTPGSTPEALAEAEGKLTLELLKYVRYARGGRVLPSSLSRILDQDPPVKDPKVVMTELDKAEHTDSYLREQHPKHEQFKLLQAALLKARGATDAPPPPVDEALKIKIPETKKTLKIGSNDPAVALLRKRLKVPAADDAKANVFDDALEDAVRAYQTDKGLKASGQLSNATRQALNSEGEPKAKNRDSDVQRIVLNMERWRWMPENLGDRYVWNNIPEFYTRVIKNGEEIFKEKIIVGMPSWATPVFSASMQFVSFNPSWGMPDGIKSRELAPRLRQAGGGFFLFGGGGGGSVLKAYGLNVYRDGKQIDPDSIDWSSADLRNYSFIQPPGEKNPLGLVKFRFPNKYDVYMHDTTQRDLFNQSYRAMSHGCIRVQNPKQFAAIVLGEGNNLSPDETGRAVANGGEITLKNPIPVHMTYFTVMADKDGKLSTFADLYGHDSKLAAALTGKFIAYERGPGDVASAADDSANEPYPAPSGKKSKKQAQPETLADAISNIFSN